MSEPTSTAVPTPAGATGAAGGPFSLAGSRVLVTGSSRGIGAGIARHLRAVGAEVVIHGRDSERVAAVAAELDAVAGVTGDLRDFAEVEAVMVDSVEALGGLDGLVNNAGGSFAASVERLSANGFDAILRTNLTSVFNVSKVALPHLLATRGSIVNIGSLAAIRPAPTLAHYAAAKAGVNQLTSCLAAEWAGTGVRVNTLLPGIIATEAALEVNYGDDPERIAAAARRVGVGRLGTPDDIAHACHFLLSPAAGFVNGTTLVVDGGPDGTLVV